MKNKSLIVLSGGQDSTTCAVIAKHAGDELTALAFNYGQRHLIEMESALKVADYLNIPLTIVNLDDVLLSTSPLTSSNVVELYEREEQLPKGIANTFVPCRNALFLTIACNHALANNADTIITGVNQTDYSGYPDCRRDFIDSMEDTLSLANFGTHGKFKIKTPLIDLSKAETVIVAYDILGEQKFNELFALTHTCYQGVKGGCGECAACILRDRGFKEAGIDDPLWKLRKSNVHSFSRQQS